MPPRITTTRISRTTGNIRNQITTEIIRTHDDDDDFIELIKSFKYLINLKLYLALGIIILFGYCFSIIKQYPFGLDINSTLLFIFIALGVGIFYIFITLTIILTSLCLSQLLKWDRNTKVENSSYIIVTIISLIFFISSEPYELFENTILKIFTILVLLITLIIFFLVFYFITKQNNHFTKETIFYINLLTMIGLVIPFLTFIFPDTQINKKVFEQLNIYQEQISIAFTKNTDWKHIQQISETTGNIFVTDCNNQKIIHNVDILWQSIGTESVIQLNSFININDGKKHPEHKLTIKSENLKKISTTQEANELCIVLNSSQFFESNSSSAIKIKDIIKNANNFANYTKPKDKDSKPAYNLTKISFVGFSDKRPSATRKNNNIALSHKRAQAIKSELMKQNQDINGFCSEKNENCPVWGEGSKYATEKCEGIKEKEDLAHCLAADRKVEIKFHIKKTSDKTKETPTAS